MAFYFESFPTINYQVSKTVTKKCLDIIRRYDVPYYYYGDNGYTIIRKADHASPESLAFTIYDDIDNYWPVLLYNKIINCNTEWAISEDNLEIKINKKYPGISLFVTLDDELLMNTHSSDAGYRIGEMVYVYNASDVLIGSGKLYEYNRSFGHMKIDMESFDLSNGTYITDEYNMKKMFIARKIDFVADSVYGFRDQDGKEVSPYHRSNPEDPSSTIINLYIGDDAESTLSNLGVDIVTIRDYEKERNEEFYILYAPTTGVINEIEREVLKLNRLTNE